MSGFFCIAVGEGALGRRFRQGRRPAPNGPAIRGMRHFSTSLRIFLAFLRVLPAKLMLVVGLWPGAIRPYNEISVFHAKSLLEPIRKPVVRWPSEAVGSLLTHCPDGLGGP